MSELDRILSKYRFPLRDKSANFNFEEIENRVGFELPKDYKEFHNKYTSNEIQIGDEWFRLWEFDRLLEWNDDYEIINSLTNTIGIGDNGGGEFIGLEKMSNGKIRTILTPFIDLDKEYHIEIGDSFTNFLYRLVNEEKWFNANDTNENGSC